MNDGLIRLTRTYPHGDVSVGKSSDRLKAEQLARRAMTRSLGSILEIYAWIYPRQNIKLVDEESISYESRE